MPSLRFIICSVMLRLSLTYSIQGVQGWGQIPWRVVPPPTDEVRLNLSMHEVSLSVPEPMLSMTMLTLQRQDRPETATFLHPWKHAFHTSIHDLVRAMSERKAPHYRHRVVLGARSPVQNTCRIEPSRSLLLVLCQSTCMMGFSRGRF